MRTMNIETRVGFFAIMTIAMFSFGVFWLNGGRFMERGNRVEILFNRVDGLRPGAPVKLSGVDVGRIKKIYFNESQQVIVVALLKPEFKVLEGSKATIATAGVIGEKHLEIQPGSSHTLLKGNQLRGTDPIDTEDFYKNVAKILDDLQEVTSSLKVLMTDSEMVNSLKNSLKQLDSFTANIDNFSQRIQGIPLESMVGKLDQTLTHLETLTRTAGPGIERIISQITTASDQLTHVLVKANRFMDEVNGDGKAAQDIREILDLAAKAMRDIEALTSTLVKEKDHIGPILEDAEKAAHSIASAADSLNQMLDGMNSDGPSSASLGDTLKKTSDMVNKAHRMVANLERIEHRVDLSTVDESWHLNYRMDIPWGDRASLIFDWQDIGDGNSLSLQAGYSFDKLRFRGGYIHEAFGVGVDWTPTQRLELALDVWNNDEIQTDLYIRYFLNRHWFTGVSAYSLFDDPIYGWQLGYWF